MSTARSSAARERIIQAATEILAVGGPQAVSTRAVAAAARTQAPTLYRIFGDKQGLLDAVAAEGFTSYLRQQAELDWDLDPVEALRRGWDAHISYGLAHPHVYSLAYGDARGGALTPAAAAADEILALLVHRAAQAGRLRVPEVRARQLLHAAGCGTVLTLIATPADRRDLALSRAAQEAVLSAVTTDPPPHGSRGTDDPAADVVIAAVHLRALLPEANGLTSAERALLDEWLERLAEAEEQSG